MKLCDLTQFYSPVSGGVKRYLQQKVAYLQERTQDSHLLIVPGERDTRTVDERSVTYTIASPLISKTSRYRALLRVAALREILLTEKPQVIECGDPYQVAWQALKAAELLGARAFGFYHSHFSEALCPVIEKAAGETAARWAMAAGRAYTRALYNRFSRTLVPSPALAELLATWGVHNTCPVELGVDTSVFKPGDNTARAQFGLKEGQILLLYVGRLAPEKNTELLCDTVRLLPEQYHLLVVGDGQQRHLVERLRAERAAVSWLPYCSDPQRLAALYRAADLFVHPGVHETFGLVAVESQACGTPVVGIRGSYMDRVIQSDQSHWASENSARALAAAIMSAKSEDRCSLSKRVSERFAWGHVFERLFAIYRLNRPPVVATPGTGVQ